MKHHPLGGLDVLGIDASLNAHHVQECMQTQSTRQKMKSSTSNNPVQSWLAGGKKTLALQSAACALLIGATAVQASLIAYEPFNYSGSQINNGTPVPSGTPTQTTGGGWVAGNWSCAPAPGGALTWSAAGMSYPGLPTASGSISTLGANYLYEQIASAPTSGSVWVSFLFQQAGDNGGTRNGIILENSSGTGIMFAYHQYSGSQGFPCLMAMSGTVSVGTELGDSSTLQTYTSTNLYVIQFTYSGGVVTSISVYSNPTAGQNTAPAPDFTVTSGLPSIGSLVNFGLANPAPNQAITVDEFRVGTTFGDVVGAAGTTPTIPTTLALSVAAGNEVSWTANNTDSYQPQSSTDGINWNNLGGVLVGSAVSSVYDPAPVAFYQVLDYTVGGTGNAEPNGSFEIPDVNSTGALDWSGPANGVDGNGNTINVYATNNWGAVTPVDGTNLLYMETTTPATGPVTAPNTYLNSDLFPIPAGGVTYPLSFSSANPVTVGGANPQYQIEFWDSGNAFISATAFFSIGAGATWTTITNNFAAPANAAYMSINFIQAMGAGSGWDWVTLIDNIQVGYNLPGPTNVLAATVQSGAIFTATVQTNGITATDATGNVEFLVNSVDQSTGAVGSGVANSTPSVVPASYTVTAIYAGDGTYLGSTNSLVVGGSNFGPGKGTVSLSGGNSTVVMSGIAGNQYSMERATNVMFTAGISNFPAATAPTGGNVTNVDNFSDLGGAPKAAFYRLQYIP